MALIRVATCGSVDDGKSTLLGRLLYETNSIPIDTIDAARNTRRPGSTVQIGEIDFSLFTDGLEAEREQGITIDVAYRSINLKDGSRLLLADSPGHEQYTRNMVVATSQADVAILLVDASRKLTKQTRRHLYLCSLLRVQTVIFAINKIDVVSYSESRFKEIKAELAELSEGISIESTYLIPVSAINGDNISKLSANTPWYSEIPLLEVLSDVVISKDKFGTSPRVPIQIALRNETFRGIAGTVVDGSFEKGEKVFLHPSRVESRIASIITATAESAVANCGETVTIVLEDEIDAARGDVLLKYPLASSMRFKAILIWMDETPLTTHRSYFLLSGPSSSPAMVHRVDSHFNPETLSFEAGDILELNGIGNVEIIIDKPMVFTTFENSKISGSFILVDRQSSNTSGVGVITALTESNSDDFSYEYEINKDKRALQKSQKAKVIWLTGLSSAGKSTLANQVEKDLFAKGKHCFVLDGDNLRKGLNKDLGFSSSDRAENVRRVAEVARVMVDAGLIVIVALVSPFKSDREAARSLFAKDEFFEVWVNTSKEVCISRDSKGLYKRAQTGKLFNLTGMGQEYEPPDNPQLIVDGSTDVKLSAAKIMEMIN